MKNKIKNWFLKKYWTGIYNEASRSGETAIARLANIKLIKLNKL